jgi:hypothetical protein
MRTDCTKKLVLVMHRHWWPVHLARCITQNQLLRLVKLSKLQISKPNTLVQKETSGYVEGKPAPSDTPPHFD